jgi:TetR/AcrR family fatty acid metabolism transcriptional regulator
VNGVITTSIDACYSGVAAKLDQNAGLNEYSFSTMPRSTRTAKPAPAFTDKRAKILDAATHVFAERGFFGAQVADIASRAGIAAGTVYLYFRSKDDVLLSVFDRTMEEAIREGRAALEGIDDPAERLRRIARLHLERLGRDRALAVVFQVELRQSTKFMTRLSTTQLRDYLGLIRDTIADGQARGTFRQRVPATLGAKIFFGALDEMATNWILSDRRYALVEDADAVVDVFLHGVRAA